MGNSLLKGHENEYIAGIKRKLYLIKNSEHVGYFIDTMSNECGYAYESEVPELLCDPEHTRDKGFVDVVYKI